jgi:hypothetical protein
MFLDYNENENITYQNLWYTAKTMLRGKFIAIRSYVKKKTNRDYSNKQPNNGS